MIPEKMGICPECCLAFYLESGTCPFCQSPLKKIENEMENNK